MEIKEGPYNSERSVTYTMHAVVLIVRITVAVQMIIMYHKNEACIVVLSYGILHIQTHKSKL